MNRRNQTLAHSLNSLRNMQPTTNRSIANQPPSQPPKTKHQIQVSSHPLQPLVKLEAAAPPHRRRRRRPPRKLQLRYSHHQAPPIRAAPIKHPVTRRVTPPGAPRRPVTSYTRGPACRTCGAAGDAVDTSQPQYVRHGVLALDQCSGFTLVEGGVEWVGGFLSGWVGVAVGWWVLGV